MSGSVEVEYFLQNFHSALYRVDLTYDHRTFTLDFAQLATPGIFLQIGKYFAECRRLEITSRFVRDEVKNHFPLFQYHFFHTQLLGHTPQAYHPYQFFAFMRNAAEAVAQSFGKGLYVALLFQIVELLIERDAFRCTRDIVVWEKQFEIRLDLAIGREILGFIVVCLGI